jgi:outer membrane immunogenic protein
MKKLLLASAAMLALFGGTATAADLSVRAPVYRAPPPVYVFSWTGCYVGGNVGGVWIRKDETLTTAFGPAVAGTAFGSHDADSVIGGVQAGCNYQVGGWVFGIQGDYDWTDASGSHVNPAIPTWTHNSNTKSLASVTGRVGYAWDRLLGYVKGGGAWERDEYTITAPFGIASTSETRSGWTVGVGLEYAFTNWLTGFVEYDYYDFGTRSNAFVTPAGTPFSIDVKETKNLVKVGLNWKFGGFAGAPY